MSRRGPASPAPVVVYLAALAFFAFAAAFSTVTGGALVLGDEPASVRSWASESGRWFIGDFIR